MSLKDNVIVTNIKLSPKIFEKERFSCVCCNYSFSSHKALNTHQKSHTSWKCEVCHKFFKNKIQLTRHKRSHTRERPFKCDLCVKTFSLKSNLRIHYRKHTGEKPYKYDPCYSFDLFPGSQTFTYRRKALQVQFMHQCFLSEIPSEKSHALAHWRPYKCDVCAKVFTEASKLS